MASRKPLIVPSGKLTQRMPTDQALYVRTFLPIVLTDDSTQYLLIGGNGHLDVVLSSGTQTTMPVGLNG